MHEKGVNENLCHSHLSNTSIMFKPREMKTLSIDALHLQVDVKRTLTRKGLSLTSKLQATLVMKINMVSRSFNGKILFIVFYIFDL